ncbi:hypothetical protein GE061_015492 [Apolygus lucorum]|uniref:Uncharacterized protein n=1 Tax=Apolygus lucorum TaxID=248454 RepID=A0A6A4JAW8_APOLU|nr:hypothetical protein GE061_015492 [Apolygus lucorum]
MGVLAWVLVCAVVSLLEDGAADSVVSEPVTRVGPGAGQIFRNLLEEGRGKKKYKKDIMQMITAMTVVIISFLVPKVIAVALYASWKGITISLIALAIASMAALKNAHSGQSEKSGPHIVIEKKADDHHRHEHWWRKIRQAEPTYIEDDHNGPYHGWHDDYES